ncbi:hypothetical protein DFP72DRAFT_552376 [Ephemerocybe angulata]|uniref:Uncharacterized protein n=1 Tax=Ephemerocybe angulata TaxID=980116 RepID=A0A8H6HMB6_9AGAR|nr:hypothetical protein DFP72DRAFT_552376 [Tulosesus angulatus]
MPAPLRPPLRPCPKKFYSSYIYKRRCPTTSVGLVLNPSRSRTAFASSRRRVLRSSLSTLRMSYDSRRCQHGLLTRVCSACSVARSSFTTRKTSKLVTAGVTRRKARRSEGDLLLLHLQEYVVLFLIRLLSLIPPSGHWYLEQCHDHGHPQLLRQRYLPQRPSPSPPVTRSVRISSPSSSGAWEQGELVEWAYK